MATFVKTPHRVQAVRWTGDMAAFEDEQSALGFDLGFGWDDAHGEWVVNVPLDVAWAKARPGDWVVREPEGYFDVVPHDYFMARHQPAEEGD